MRDLGQSPADITLARSAATLARLSRPVTADDLIAEGWKVTVRDTSRRHLEGPQLDQENPDQSKLYQLIGLYRSDEDGVTILFADQHGQYELGEGVSVGPWIALRPSAGRADDTRTVEARRDG